MATVSSFHPERQLGLHPASQPPTEEAPLAGVRVSLSAGRQGGCWLPGPGLTLGCSAACCLDRITSTVACDMDLAKYPLDEQECMLHLESCECPASVGREGGGAPAASPARGQGGTWGGCEPQGLKLKAEGAATLSRPALLPRSPPGRLAPDPTRHPSASLGPQGSSRGPPARVACASSSFSGLCTCQSASVAPGPLAPGRVFPCCPRLCAGPRGWGAPGSAACLWAPCRRLLVRGHCLLLVGKPGADPRAGPAAAGAVHHYQLPLQHGADELQVR